jgi:hypothetical protein
MMKNEYGVFGHCVKAECAWWTGNAIAGQTAGANPNLIGACAILDTAVSLQWIRYSIDQSQGNDKQH